MVVKKTHSASARHYKTKTKHVTVHPHHARPFRKRHIGLLVLSLTGLITIAILIFQYRDQVVAGVASSRNFISDMFQPASIDETSVESTNGFSLKIDQQKFYAVAVDGFTGTLYDSSALSQKRAYSKVQIATDASTQAKQSRSVMTIAYHGDARKQMTGNELSALALGSAGIDRKNVELVKVQQASIDGKTFEHSIWKTKQSDGPVKNLRASFSTYAGETNGHPITITISEGITGEPGEHPQFNKILQSIRFSTVVATVSQQSQQSAQISHRSAPSVIDTLLMAEVASAATAQTVGDSEKIAALYGPAVAKVYNLYCMDLIIDGKEALRGGCKTGSGTGFFVGQDGHFATNGHVSSADPKDLAIYNAVMRASMGESSLLEYLLMVSKAKDSEFDGVTDRKELMQKVVDILYDIDDSKFEKRNDIQDLFVVLGEKQPDGAELVKSLAERKKATLDDTWKPAKTVAEDFRSIDGTLTGVFRSSDVAILKVEGSNFPVARLGSIDDVTQGANMSILGFPGSASQNGLVDSKTTTATLTTGKVSAKKNATGSDKRLIETDTTIGHGNSGGPAFSDSGDVIGIATYTSDGAGRGDGTYNYVRDIKDLKDLATKSNVTFDTKSQTQQEWETGMGYFYESRYSKALKHFEKVKELYPNHNKVAEFIATAQKRIANGEDVVDFPIVPVVIAAVVLTTGLGLGIFLIVRHKKHHSVYKAGVVQGSVVPGVPQTVAVSPGPTVQAVDPLPQQVPSPTTDQLPQAPQPTQSPQVVIAPPVLQVEQPVVEPVPEQIQPVESVPPASEFVQPIITATPRDPSPFSVPTRVGGVQQPARPSVSNQFNGRQQ